ncbi:ribbon-helix-helix domain-containing protein [Microtetraspora malaysiensis]|uniref:ribbon-helix-helix domain-containing protein n=1 Tax=Microtetraspora malaysiensis TaxID=161358 RepID=UPI003D94ACF4
MTKKITISLPDDLAAQAQASGNASAYIADALRQRRRVEQDLAIMDDLWGVGWQDGITDEERARAARLFTGDSEADAA